MKKLFAIAVISVVVWSCGHKMTPTTSAEKPAVNSSVATGTSTTATAGTVAAATTTATAAGTNASTPATTVGKTTTGTEATSAIVDGMNTYNAKCGKCHGLKVVQDYTADRWISIMQVMAPKARLSDVEKENVLLYVKTNAKRG